MAQPRTGLTSEQIHAYETEGVTRLPGAVPAADVAAMVDVLWTRMRARWRVHRDQPGTWRVERPAQLTSRIDDFAVMASAPVRALLDHMLGAWKPPARWGIPLVTLPGFTTQWDVPHRHWHLDTQAAPEPPRLARLFLVLSASRPGGGGTGYVAGSHRVIRDLARREGRVLRSAEARGLLGREPWFAALATLRPGEDRIARFMAEPGDAAGVPVQVREMLGEPGDVLLMDPLVLHAATPNALATPRMMLTEWVYGVD